MGYTKENLNVVPNLSESKSWTTQKFNSMFDSNPRLWSESTKLRKHSGFRAQNSCDRSQNPAFRQSSRANIALNGPRISAPLARIWHQIDTGIPENLANIGLFARPLPVQVLLSAPKDSPHKMQRNPVNIERNRCLQALPRYSPFLQIIAHLRPYFPFSLAPVGTTR